MPPDKSPRASDRRHAGEDLRARLTRLYEESRATAQQFREQVVGQEFHPFIPANYEMVEATLRSLQQPGLRFLEWGSAIGTITIMADMLGFEAYGIELDGELVRLARAAAERFGSGARFAAGSFLPAGYRWKPETGDPRLGTIGHGRPGYRALGLDLEDFDIIYTYPWGGEEPIMHDVMQRRGGKDSRLLVNMTRGVEIYQHGRRVG